MALPEMKYAVYYGTITMKNGSPQTFSAADVALLYGVENETYLSVPLAGASPFDGADELEYIHLKPLPDGNYYDAKDAFNVDNEIQWKQDFDARRGGKWAVPPIAQSQDGVW